MIFEHDPCPSLQLLLQSSRSDAVMGIGTAILHMRCCLLLWPQVLMADAGFEQTASCNTSTKRVVLSRNANIVELCAAPSQHTLSATAARRPASVSTCSPPWRDIGRHVAVTTAVVVPAPTRKMFLSSTLSLSPTQTEKPNPILVRRRQKPSGTVDREQVH